MIMTDLTYCYTHMTEEILHAVDILMEMCDVQLSDEELEIPPHMIPPEPDDDGDALPCHVHPSYPYGNPTNPSHPAAFPYATGDPASRALYEDIVHVKTAAPGKTPLRWQELALDQLLPVDETMVEAQKAALARETATTNAPGHNPAAEDRSADAEEAHGDDSENSHEENAEQDEQGT